MKRAPALTNLKSPLVVQAAAHRDDLMLEARAVYSDGSRTLGMGGRPAPKVCVQRLDLGGPVARKHVLDTATHSPSGPRFVADVFRHGLEDRTPGIFEMRDRQSAGDVQERWRHRNAEPSAHCSHPAELGRRVHRTKRDRRGYDGAGFVGDAAEIGLEAVDDIA